MNLVKFERDRLTRINIQNYNMKSGNFFNYEQAETGFMTYDGFMVLNLTIEIMKVRGKTVLRVQPTHMANNTNIL